MLLTCVAILLATGLAVYLYLKARGLLDEVRVWQGPGSLPRARIVYKFGRGGYSNTASFFKEITGLCPQGKIIGIFYDNPEIHLVTNLRWAVGLVVEEDGVPIVPDYLFRMLPKWGYSFHDIPKVEKSIRASFPFVGLASVFIAPKRVYAAINRYSKKTGVYGFPAVEVYSGGRVEYMMPLDNHDGFTVPEAL